MHFQVNHVLAMDGCAPGERLCGKRLLAPVVSVVLLILHVLNSTAYGQTARAGISGSGDAAEASASARLAASYGKLPLSFEVNQGQADAQVRFLSRGDGYALFLSEKEAVLALSKQEKTKANKSEDRPRVFSDEPNDLSFKTDVVRMQLAGARANARVSGEDELPGVANYFIGNDPTKWHRSVPTYGKVKYAGVYPGVDLIYYGNQQRLEYDFVVAPHADTTPIHLHFAGAKKLKLDPSGNLEIIAENGQIAFHKPVAYQEKNGALLPVHGQFTLLAGDSVGFAIGRYDRSKPLVIDPTLSYSTYIGGSNNASYGTAIAVDSSGNAYVTGVVYATNFPVTSGAYQTTNHNSSTTFDAFVAKLNPTGTALVYATYLGGSGNTSVAGTLNHGDYPTGISIDSAGNAYVAGMAYSVDFPVTSGAFQTTNQGGANGVSNGFVTKINAAGSGLVYSTYLGGSGLSGYAGEASLGDTGGDGCASIAVDASGDAYLTGTAYSTNFPVTSGAYQTTNKSASAQRPNAFVARLNPQGTALDYATYLGGSNGDGGSGIAVDSDGNAYVDGGTYSTDFPVTSGVFQSNNQTLATTGSNGFITKLNSTGSSLLYSTYLGGSGNSNGPSGNNNGDIASSIALNSADDAYIFGLTSSEDFPVTAGAFQAINNAYASARGPNFFVAKVNPSATKLIYASYLGGSALDANAGSSGLAVDSSGDAYVTGYAMGSDFPVSANAYQSSPVCALEVIESISEYESPVFSELSADGSKLIYSAYFGGSGRVDISTPVSTVSICDMAYGIALDSQDNVYLTGNAESTNFPITPGALQTSNPSNESAFVSKFLMNSNATLIATTTALTASANPVATGTSVTFTATVTPSSGNGVPTGNITFSIDGGPGTAIALNGSGQASYSTSTLTVGANTITASYSGDLNYSASNATPLTETIVGAAASISAASGTGQSAVVGSAFAEPLTVLVEDAKGDPVSGASVSFTGTGLSFANATVTTGADGMASTAATPTTAGNLTATATTTGVSGSATFALIGTASAPPPGSGIISTYAGEGTAGFSGDGGAATNAEISQPVGNAMDGAGNLYFSDSGNNRIRMITPAGVISTFAGNGTAGFSGDGGVATSAELSGPGGIAFDSVGNLYIADAGNQRVRKVTPDGIISTIAGNGTPGYNGDGIAATSAELSTPNGIVVDNSGDIYIGDYFNNRVREVNTAGIISTVAGNGTGGYNGDGVLAIDAELYWPAGLALDASGDLYIADDNNSRIREVNSAGVISTIAGTGYGGYNGDGIPATSAELYAPDRVAVDSAGNVYISEYGNNRIRKVNTSGIISTVAGTGTPGFSGDGGAATSAEINTPRGLTVDASGNLYISDANNNRIRKVQYQTSAPVFSPAAGSYTSAQSVTITDTTAGATIYYTTDGSAPTASSTAYTTAIAVSSSEILKAIATASEYNNSSITSATYTISIGPAASISVVSGSGQTAAYGSAFASPLTVLVEDANGNPVPGVLVSFVGTGLSFTGTPATTGSNGEASVTATATATGSLVAAASTSGVPGMASFSLTATSLGTAATPTFTPGAGTYTSAQQVTVSDSTTGAVIYYTIGATTPTTSSTQYSSAIAVGSTETINAIAVAPGYANSAVATAAYTINLPAASFSLTASPSTASISAGKSVAFTLTVTPQNGFTQTVSFSCSGLPTGSNCSFSPQTVTPAGAASTTTLTIAAATGAMNEKLQPWENGGAATVLALLLWPFCKRRGWKLWLLALLSLSTLLAVGCAGSPKVRNYTVTVTASGGSVTQTASLSLTITP